MSTPNFSRVSLPNAVLEVDVRGSGEPVVMIQTALFADEFVPLADHRSLRDDYQVIVYHRRGYAGSSAVHGDGSIVRDAVDCQFLLAELGVQGAHVVGGSYAGAVAMQLAVTAPACVHSLCLIEPPPVHIRRADQFLAANAELIEEYQLHGSLAALDQFLTRLVGRNWRQELERQMPHGVAHAERDADTFFATDIPALLGWRFSAEDARRISQPAMYVGGTDSGPWFADVRQLILAWLPHAEEVVVEGADHSLVVTHTAEVAKVIARFLRRHPISD